MTQACEGLLDSGRGEPRKKVALVTGASSGLGAAFARALAARGYELVLTARWREKLEQLVGELHSHTGRAPEVLVADLTRDEDVEAVAQRISADANFQLLVNNAGFGALGDYHEAGLSPQMAMHRVHVLATARLTHAALGRLIARNCGGVINVSSVAAFVRMPGHTSYNATKAWMNAFTECLYLELRSRGSQVRVQLLCPGYIYTEFHDVLGMDRNKVMPMRGFWMSAGYVAAASLKAFDCGKWMVIPGWRYRLIVRLLRHLPRAVLHPIQTRIAHKRKSAILKNSR